MKEKLLKKDDFERKQKSFFRHALLCCQAAIFAVIMVIIWQELRKNGYHLCKEDEVVLTGGNMSALYLFCSVAAGGVFISVYEKYKKVMACVLPNRLRDEQERPKCQSTFLSLRDERLPIAIWLLLFFPSVLSLVAVMTFDYKGVMSGVLMVFSVSFMLAYYAIVIRQLDNPAKSPWLIERVPPEWLKRDVDKFFKLEEGHKPKARKKAKRK